MRKILGLTKNDIIAYGDRMSANIPESHNRKKLDYKNSAAKRIILTQSADVPGDYQNGDFIAYLMNVNLGNAKYPYMVKMVKFGKIERVTPKTVELWDHRVYKDSILGIIRE